MKKAEVVHLQKEKPEEGPPEEEEKESGKALPRSFWSGSLRIGLVNIPVKAVTMTRDKRISFRMLHRTCKTPISFKRFCQEGDEVGLADIVYGYPLERNRYVILEKKEIDDARPESKNVIELDRFVNFFQADPHYFERTYLLLPDRSEAAYSLLRKVMEETGKAAIGRMTIRTRERVVLVHYYEEALVATTLRYSDEVLDPADFSALKELPEPGDKELELANEIVKGLTGDLDIAAYRDEYGKKIEALVRSRMKGVVVTKEKKKARPPAKSLMDALRQTAESLK